MSYAPQSDSEIKELLSACQVDTIEELFESVPSEFKQDTSARLNPPLDEYQILQKTREAAQNVFTGKAYIGYGNYAHRIPVAVNHLGSLRQFVTSYTPYQPEVAQGILQALYEYQSQMAVLTSLPVANASLYDATTALLEAVRMILRTDIKNTERPLFLLSEGILPACREVLFSYFNGDADADPVFIEVPLNKKTGATDWQQVAEQKPAGILFQNPTFFGSLETELEKLKIMFPEAIIAYGCHDPHLLTLLTAPKEIGARIVWGDAQSLGTALNFGGPSLGFLAAHTDYLRQMPGRLVGKTTARSSANTEEEVDAYVITLATREQHIRREKATSNICSNQTLIAVRASIYMAALGWEGMRDVAVKCIEKTDNFRQALQQKKIDLVFDNAIWGNEISYVLKDRDKTLQKALEKNIIPGFSFGSDVLISCLNETVSESELTELAEILG